MNTDGYANVGSFYPALFIRVDNAAGRATVNGDLCRQNPHTEESGPGPDRLDAQTVHRQSGRVLAELLRTAAVRVSCQAQQRDRLERLCRYITRPALCVERLSTNAAGQVGSSHSELLS